MKRKAILLVVLALLLPLSSCGFGSGEKTISARFSDSSGLFVGNDVGVLGVPIGRVTSITPDGADVVVKMSIKADQRIPATAGAVVVARSVATDRYVEITPVYSSGPEMPDGGTIEARRTRTPVDFDQVLSSLNSLATGLSGDASSKEAVARFLKMQSAALDGKGPMINKAIHEIAGATNAVSGQRQNITGTLNSLDTLTKQLADNKSTINEFIRQVAAASSMLSAERENFQTALRSISRMIAVVATFAQQNRTDIVKALHNSTAVSNDLLAKKKALAEILEVMPLVLQNVPKAEHNGWLTVRIDPSVLLPLGDQLAALCGSAVPPEICGLLGGNLPDLTTLLGQLTGGLQ